MNYTTTVFSEDPELVEVEVISFSYIPPEYSKWAYSSWDSDLDYSGYYEIDFKCVVQGENITSSLSLLEYNRIEQEIILLYGT